MCVFTLLGTLTYAGLSFHIDIFIEGFVFLLPVLLISVRWGFREATIASIASVLCLDYLFTEPRYSFYMAARHDWVALCAFETLALAVSGLAAQVKAQAENAQQQRLRFERLYRISKEAFVFDQTQYCGSQLVQITKDVLAADGVSLWDAIALRTVTFGDIDLDHEDLRSWYEDSHDEMCVQGKLWMQRLRVSEKSLGVLCVSAREIDPLTLASVASIAALALERARAFEERSDAEAANRTEQLRSAVLDGLAHAFKTPLTIIQSASSGLLEIRRLDDRQRELVEFIDHEATRLSDLTTRLLTTARLDGARLEVHREQVLLTELVDRCCIDVSSGCADHWLSCDEVSADSQVWADPLLMKLALDQLIDNAAKYSASGSQIRISLRKDGDASIVGVHNDGSFIRPEERQRIFMRYYRAAGSEYKAAGTGIGLSVTKRIVEAHGGSVWVDSDVVCGTTVFFTLPHRPGRPE
ncbi:Osmosensitive K+ channel histidine kinase KdpD [Acidisarcina polymorpha]|uniref:histidine kinase n=2 Tax=Acidisarcina polymorpha TaxID=2211140 RepID=A0A2Z5FXP3_9BACT|nr:Osmosensitive K+ channel histidine kinase KdpD [Acidisarcina polymorpha]